MTAMDVNARLNVAMNGEAITWKAVASYVPDGMGGRGSETYTESTTKAIISEITPEEVKFLPEGIPIDQLLKASLIENVSIYDVITYSSTNYRVLKKEELKYKGSVYGYSIMMRKDR